MRKHELKILPQYFERVVSGEKTFEIRENDRDFQTGDEIELKEFDKVMRKFTGRYVSGRISYIFHGGEYGLEQGYCVFSFKINKVAMEELK